MLFFSFKIYMDLFDYNKLGSVSMQVFVCI